MIKDKSGKVAIGSAVKTVGFLIIALGGGYSSLTKDFKIGSVIIAVGALIVAVGELL